MKNILLITSLYPSDDLALMNNTAVCHYFAKEWIKSGYNVRVIHLYHIYPFIYYPILKMMNSYLASKTGHAILEARKTKEHSYHIDGIKVTRIPTKKYRPHGMFSNDSIAKTCGRICEILDAENFKPEFILGHFLHPSIDVISRLKSIYPNAVSTISLHGEEKVFREEVKRNLASIDLIGYRSFPIRKAFELLYGELPCFMCFSGVPEKFISLPKKFDNGIKRFVFVGSFIERKYPEVLIPAIHDAMCGEKALVTYVGSGKLEGVLQGLTREYEKSLTVHIAGRLPREQVTQELDNGDVFIMISKSETFGLVYLEAMARGCIVVASKNEGMDGIIKDGENGFLCEAGCTKELTEIISKIRRLSNEELNALSVRAIATAKAFSDSIVAKSYIDAVESFKK